LPSNALLCERRKGGDMIAIKKMKESLNGWALQENSKVDSLEQEREELRRSNSTLTAELSKVGSLSFLGADNC
jgi:hypothetical protein